MINDKLPLTLPELAKILAEFSGRMHAGAAFYDAVNPLADKVMTKKMVEAAAICRDIESHLDSVVSNINQLVRVRREMEDYGKQ